MPIPVQRSTGGGSQCGRRSRFRSGYRVNPDGTRNLLEACRKSSAAAGVRQFAGSVRRRLPAVVDDLITTNPQTSYGTQKVIGEYLVNDYSRKGLSRRPQPALADHPRAPRQAQFASTLLPAACSGAAERSWCARLPWRI
jgi:hypothetical protein